MVGRGAAHVGVLAAREVDALDRAELGQDVQGPEDRRAADPQAADPRLVDEIRRREVARLGADQARDREPRFGQSVAGTVERQGQWVDGIHVRGTLAGKAELVDTQSHQRRVWHRPAPPQRPNVPAGVGTIGSGPSARSATTLGGMAFNLLRGRLPGQRSDGPPKLAIGEADAHVFNCPTCSRPLNDGTPEVPCLRHPADHGRRGPAGRHADGLRRHRGPVHRRHGHLGDHQGPHGPDGRHGVRPGRRGREAGRERGAERDPGRHRDPRPGRRPVRPPPGRDPRRPHRRRRHRPLADRRQRHAPTTSPRSCAPSRRTPPIGADIAPRIAAVARGRDAVRRTAPRSTRPSRARRTAAWATRSPTRRRIAPTRRPCSRSSGGCPRSTPPRGRWPRSSRWTCRRSTSGRSARTETAG